MSTSAKPASMRILRHLSGPPVTLLPGLARPIVHIRSALPAECERRGKKGGNAGQVCGGSGGAPRHGEKCKRRDKKGGKQRGGGRWNGTEQGGERKGWMTPRHGDEPRTGPHSRPKQPCPLALTPPSVDNLLVCDSRTLTDVLPATCVIERDREREREFVRESQVWTRGRCRRERRRRGGGRCRQHGLPESR